MNRLITSVLLVVALASCVGTRARDNALLPAARTAWPEVRVDLEAGIADGLADGDLTAERAAEVVGYADELTAALTSGDRFALKMVPWDTDMHPLVIRGITSALEAGQLGPNGAQILYQRATNFTAVILVLQERTTNMFSMTAPTYQQNVATATRK